MKEQTKTVAGPALFVTSIPQGHHIRRDAAPKRERKSMVVAAAPGVLIHRIGDDDAPQESRPAQRRRMTAANRSKTEPRPEPGARGGAAPLIQDIPQATAKSGAAQSAQDDARQPAAVTAAAHGAPTVAPARVVTTGPAYSLPRALRAASQRAREAQPRLINMSDASYAGVEE
ncbi:hypothetical protein [Bordetella genomosp. 9]|uniref:Uncharacterized protein n=1 Tax=Bordetella genomosp. 9 TaxID=1416803 RepID=A0A1W6YY48_9BORD|nr:hypothetical protein [Bordetella genomosp. 9]ARP86017.1 hypothetical protein CAL13_07210 [Bordetella genomosp. 9]